MYIRRSKISTLRQCLNVKRNYFFFSFCLIEHYDKVSSVCCVVVAGAAKKIFDKYLLEINKELSYVHFELRACRDQYDGQVCYGVVNTVSDDQSKLGTKYSVPQIAFFKGIVSFIWTVLCSEVIICCV